MKKIGRLLLLNCMIVGAGAMTGCTWDYYHVFTPPTPPPGPIDSMVLRGDRLEPELPVTPGTAQGDLAGAHELFRRGDYANAQKVFHHIAENQKNSDLIAEEARYYEAECLRLEEHYPKAADTYNKLLITFPSGVHRDQALKRMFDIANYWLGDTDQEMKASREKREGKRWFVMPASFVHFEKTKPFLDEEGRAIQILDNVKLNDVTGPLADRALFLAGTVKFYREDYLDADHYFSQLVEMHQNSPLAPQALELAIISKHMSTGGPDYDGRKVAEARQLVHQAQYKYQEFASEKKEFLERQLVSINLQQAQKDFGIAEFYQRTHHPGSAYFYYEIVKRCYPGTPLAEKADQRMKELEAKHQKEIEQEKSKKPLSLPFLTPSKREAPTEPEPTAASKRPGVSPFGPAPGVLPPANPNGP
jgi:outer membrane protein assembly factor BamD (BamD/ComL family)